MFVEIKNRIDIELKNFIRSIDSSYSLSTISPVLFESIKDFLSREGKRVRPILFVIGYLGYAKKTAPGLYRSAVSIELLHDFMLVHDDIIDKSDTRRGKPSMHAKLNSYLSRYRNLNFSGEDLTIVIGDVLFAMALHAFLSIDEDKSRKEAAMKKLIEAALYTGSGEFAELLYGATEIKKLSKEDIYKIYDLKTANYTFASPLAIGATLAGATKAEVNLLFSYGISLGRAFQIKDDILGIFSAEKEIGKSNLTDLREGKKTILIWNSYQCASPNEKKTLRSILGKQNATMADLRKIRKIIISTGGLDYAKNEVSLLKQRSHELNKRLEMKSAYKNTLDSFACKTLKI